MLALLTSAVGEVASIVSDGHPRVKCWPDTVGFVTDQDYRTSYLSFFGKNPQFPTLLFLLSARVFTLAVIGTSIEAFLVPVYYLV